MRRATALAVSVCRLSKSISSHFYAIQSLCVPRNRKSPKNTKNPYFEKSRSKLVTSACYDKQRVRAYLQAFLRYTS